MYVHTFDILFLLSIDYHVNRGSIVLITRGKICRHVERRDDVGLRWYGVDHKFDEAAVSAKVENPVPSVHG